MIKKPGKEQIMIGVLVGILLLVIAIPVPETKKEGIEEPLAVPEKEISHSMEERFEEALQKISGVGRVEVLITYADDGKVLIEKDEDRSEEKIQETDSNGGTRITTTVQSAAETVYDGSDIPFVIQKQSPTVQGVLVVAEGAGNLSVKKQIRETIEALFGLDPHKISIMKMEVTR